EGLVRHFFREVLDVGLPDPFPRISYAEAMRRYGSDKPDLRIALELADVADLVRDCDFKVFAAPAKDPQGRVAAACRARRSMSAPPSSRATAPRVSPTSR